MTVIPPEGQDRADNTAGLLPVDDFDLDALLGLPNSRRERIARDAQRVAELRARGFVGPEYDVFVNDLCRETLKQLKGMLRTGALPQLSRRMFQRRGIEVFVSDQDQEVLRTSLEDRDELAVNILLAALRGFRRNGLVKGRWNPQHAGVRGPGCLQTYFIGLCALEFRQQYIAWHKKRQQRFKIIAELLDPEEFLRTLAASEYLSDSEALEGEGQILKLLDRSPEQTKAVMALLVKGYTHSEIADMLQTTYRAVEGHIYRFRRKVLAAARRGTVTIPDGYLWKPGRSGR